MKEAPKNRNGLRSKKAIKNAFIELMQDIPANKITVTEIVKKAEINRSTFYAHYYDAYNIIEEIQEDVIQEMKSLIDNLEAEAFITNPYPVLTHVSTYIEENQKLFDVCINHQNPLSFMEQLSCFFSKYIMENESIKKIPVPKEIKETQINFITGGIAYTYLKWFHNDLSCSLEELSDMIAKQIMNIKCTA